MSSNVDSEAEHQKQLLKETAARRAHHLQNGRISNEYHQHQPGLPIAYPINKQSISQSSSDSVRIPQSANRSRQPTNQLIDLSSNQYQQSINQNHQSFTRTNQSVTQSHQSNASDRSNHSSNHSNQQINQSHQSSSNLSQSPSDDPSNWVFIDSDDDDALSSSFSESLSGLPISSSHRNQPNTANQSASNRTNQSNHINQSTRISQSSSQTSAPKIFQSVHPFRVEAPAPSRSPSADEQYARELQAQFEREEEDARLVRELYEREQRDYEQGEHDRATRESQRRAQPYNNHGMDHDHGLIDDSDDGGREYTGRLGPFQIRFASGRRAGRDLNERAELVRQLQQQMMGMNGARSGSRAFSSPFGYLFGRGSASSEPDIDNMSYDELLALGDRIGEVKRRGLTNETLSQLPSYKYQPAHKPSRSTDMDMLDEKGSSQSSSSDNNNCAICLSEFEAGDEVRQLPCFHRFHTGEIDTWLKQNEKCPVCNTLVSDGLRETS